MSSFHLSGSRRHDNNPPHSPRQSTHFHKVPSKHPLSTPTSDRLPHEPNPERFVIKKVYEYRKNSRNGNYLLALIVYPDCKNFEGNKVLVFEDISELQLRGMRNIDPHFFNDNRYKTPIARFEPSKKGIDMAKDFCEMIACTT